MLTSYFKNLSFLTGIAGWTRVRSDLRLCSDPLDIRFPEANKLHLVGFPCM